MLQSALLFGAVLGGAVLGGSGCGFTDRGSGTETLEVIADATYDAREDLTDFRVEVRDVFGDPVLDATVTLVDAEIDETLLLLLGGGDLYRGSIDAYRRRLELLVLRGTDRVEGALEGPATHNIDAPEAGARHDIGSDLHVEWSTEDGVRADQVVIELTQSDFTTVLIDEVGWYTIPQTWQRLGDGRVVVRRQHAIPLDGGIGASSFTHGYEVSHEVTIVSE